ncbi:3-isopropylmalate dehydratase, small subunit [Ammonifex degensii KC4]|uniref:3-isopropylmalate dehydratase small subunit n=1 Tax=Ammonifex degensii (strain DSM 10501 / KC4) TaxID=429009 RepID=C9RAX1_AMMDK|nr:3-isopropylmalate dehydratase small subunit [Ammonifex degensii]ACX51398.1 3-isopropylmalate dehydratase, small subunit [Ammonifex degensii KC4]
MIEGRVFKFGDHIDTDLIIPARYLNTTDPAELAKHCLEDADPSFAREVRPGDVIVAGVNFGCGSSREHAPLAIKAAGVACVVAQSFARIFYRNAFNIGLPLLECPDAPRIPAGSRVRVDLQSGRIEVLDTGEVFTARPIPPFMQEIIAAGGLIPYVEKRLKGR